MTKEQFREIQFSNSVRRYQSTQRSNFLRFLSGVFFLIAVVFFIVVFLRKSYGSSGSSGLTFVSFLDWLSSRQSFKISVDISSFGVDGNWGVFDFFRVFLDYIAQFSGVLAWLGSNLVNLVIFVGQFLIFVFSA